MQMTRNTVSDSNKATTLRQLNRTVQFLAHPACIGKLCENGFGKKYCKVLWHSSSFLVLILHTGMAFYEM